MSETLESVCDKFGLLECSLTMGRRSQLIDELMPRVHRHLVDAIENLGAARGEAGDFDDIAFFALPLLRLPLLAKPAFPTVGRITDMGGNNPGIMKRRLPLRIVAEQARFAA